MYLKTQWQSIKYWKKGFLIGLLGISLILGWFSGWSFKSFSEGFPYIIVFIIAFWPFFY